jgi:hypothetical protein
MAPQTGTAILVLAAFVLPGFVTVLLRERTYHVRAGTDPFELLLTALAYSAAIYLATALSAVAAGVSAAEVGALYRGESTLATYTALAIGGLVVGPTVVTFAGKAWSDSEAKRRWMDRLGLDQTHGTRTGWDHWFAQRRPCLVRATLTDGRVVGGLFGAESVAGRAHGAGGSHDVFLEERWTLDDRQWFTGQRAPGAIGLYLPASSIATLEMYDYPPPTRSRHLECPPCGASVIPQSLVRHGRPTASCAVATALSGRCRIRRVHHHGPSTRTRLSRRSTASPAPRRRRPGA